MAPNFLACVFKYFVSERICFLNYLVSFKEELYNSFISLLNDMQRELIRIKPKKGVIFLPVILLFLFDSKGWGIFCYPLGAS